MSVVSSGSTRLLCTLCILWCYTNPSHGFGLNQFAFQSRAMSQQWCHVSRTRTPLVERRQPRSRSALSFMSLSSDDDNHEQDMNILTEKSNANNKPEQLPLTLLWAQLDIRNIFYDPSATRSELEALLARSNQDDDDDDDDDRPLVQDESELSLQLLLAQLDAKFSSLIEKLDLYKVHSVKVMTVQQWWRVWDYRAASSSF